MMRAMHRVLGAREALPVSNPSAEVFRAAEHALNRVMNALRARDEVVAHTVLLEDYAAFRCAIDKLDGAERLTLLKVLTPGFGSDSGGAVNFVSAYFLADII